ncbi:YceD family protein [Noviherbaspirillum cavernae]|nr:YceD family protein [Noviherbaspirillum cavernae]
MSAFVIDAFEFCRVKERREGRIAVCDLSRLAEESADKFGAIHWSLQGGSDNRGHSQLLLSVSGSVRLICQRCLTPFEFDVASDSVLVLARSDADADEIDAFLADDSVEVIVGSRTFNVAELIEDEALLTIPLSAKHDVCPDQLAPDVERGAEKVSPFAVLKSLKQ